MFMYKSEKNNIKNKKQTLRAGFYIMRILK